MFSHSSSRKIGYEEDAIKLEALLEDDTAESLTQEIIATRKSPNRLGTKYQKAFIDQALTQPEQFNVSAASSGNNADKQKV